LSRGPALWPSAFVAALFAWHPLHVESVAWVSERKDVLSTFFFLLTIWSYSKYVSESVVSCPSSVVQGSKFKVQSSRFLPRTFFGLSLFTFALGLMSKPMLVTLPFLLLLLDYWPLGRLRLSTLNYQPSTLFGLVFEKLPFFALSGLACVATVWAQRANGMTNLETVPFPSRVANALVTYVLYLWKMVWPRDLAVLYPYHEWPAWQVIGAGLLLFAITFCVVCQGHRRPYLAVGWFWYLGTLIPVIGLVQVGIQSMADRYSYIPSIGIFIIIAYCRRRRKETQNSTEEHAANKPFGVHPLGCLDPSPARGIQNTLKGGHQTEIVRSQALVSVSATVGMALVLLTLIICTHHQLQYWQNSISLFRHTTEVTRNNLRAEYNLGVALNRAGQKEEAVAQFRKALAISPTRLEAQGKTQTLAHYNLGIIFAEREEWSKAQPEFRAVLAEEPNSDQARASLAGCLVQQRRFDEAIGECQAVLKLSSTNAPAWRWLGIALASSGKSEEAVQALREAVRLNPDGPVELNELAWFLATAPADTVRNGVEAVSFAHRACELTAWQEPRCLGTLDAAYAESGRFEEAIATARQTRELALIKGQTALASAAEERLRLYLVGKPYRVSGQ